MCVHLSARRSIIVLEPMHSCVRFEFGSCKLAHVSLTVGVLSHRPVNSAEGQCAQPRELRASVITPLAKSPNLRSSVTGPSLGRRYGPVFGAFQVEIMSLNINKSIERNREICLALSTTRSGDNHRYSGITHSTQESKSRVTRNQIKMTRYRTPSHHSISISIVKSLERIP